MFLSQISALTCWYFIICRVVNRNAMPVLDFFSAHPFSPVHILESNEAASEPNTFPNSRRQLWVHNVVAIQFRIWKTSDIKFRENAHVSTRKRLQNKNIIPKPGFAQVRAHKDLHGDLGKADPGILPYFAHSVFRQFFRRGFNKKNIDLLGPGLHHNPKTFLYPEFSCFHQQDSNYASSSNNSKTPKQKPSSPKIHWYLPPRPATNERYESKDCHQPTAKNPPSGHRRPKWAVVSQWNMIPPKKNVKHARTTRIYLTTHVLSINHDCQSSEGACRTQLLKFPNQNK